MRINDRLAMASFVIAAVFLVAPAATAQTARPTGGSNDARPEIAADFSYLQSNAPAGGCGCFGLYGASVTLAVPIRHGQFAVVGDATTGQSSSITANGYQLELSSFTAGARFTPNLRSALHPFAQATAGVAHASQNLVNGSTAAVPNAFAALAVDLGGGVDLRLDRRFRLRLAQASYLLTTFDNGSNDRQNNLRLSAGLVLQF